MNLNGNELDGDFSAFQIAARIAGTAAIIAISIAYFSACSSDSFTANTAKAPSAVTTQQNAGTDQGNSLPNNNNNNTDANGTVPSPNTDTGTCPPAPKTLHVVYTISAGTETQVLTLNFASTAAPNICTGQATYATDPQSIASVVSKGFPADRATIFAAFAYTANLSYKAGAYTLDLIVGTHGVPNGTAVLPDQTLTLSQSSATPTWSKNEGAESALGVLGTTTTSSSCSITANGQQPSMGSYAVVVTTPAACDFRMPQVTVSASSRGGFPGGGGGFPGGPGGNTNTGPITVPIGTYWVTDGTSAAHSFPTGPTPANAPFLDDGFILLQPDGNSYLLVDAGNGHPERPGFQNTQTVASQISSTLGFGPTRLQQPNPGTAANNFTDGTLFKAGSVIAVYDDTPDMNGTIDATALAASAVSSSGFTLSWTASVTPI